MYHYAMSYPLRQNSVVEIGNWGRKLKIESIETGCKHLLLEVVFEKERLKTNPKLPSRFNCNFVCPNIESGRQFKRGYNLLYEVELVDKEAKQFITDHTLINTTNHNNIESLENTALKYWNPSNVREECKEILVESPLKIIRRA